MIKTNLYITFISLSFAAMSFAVENFHTNASALNYNLRDEYLRYGVEGIRRNLEALKLNGYTHNEAISALELLRDLITGRANTQSKTALANSLLASSIKEAVGARLPDHIVLKNLAQGIAMNPSDTQRAISLKSLLDKAAITETKRIYRGYNIKESDIMENGVISQKKLQQAVNKESQYVSAGLQKHAAIEWAKQGAKRNGNGYIPIVLAFNSDSNSKVLYATGYNQTEGHRFTPEHNLTTWGANRGDFVEAELFRTTGSSEVVKYGKNDTGLLEVFIGKEPENLSAAPQKTPKSTVSSGLQPKIPLPKNTLANLYGSHVLSSKTLRQGSISNSIARTAVFEGAIGLSMGAMNLYHWIERDRNNLTRLNAEQFEKDHNEWAQKTLKLNSDADYIELGDRAFSEGVLNVDDIREAVNTRKQSLKKVELDLPSETNHWKPNDFKREAGKLLSKSAFLEASGWVPPLTFASVETYFDVLGHRQIASRNYLVNAKTGQVVEGEYTPSPLKGKDKNDWKKIKEYWDADNKQRSVGKFQERCRVKHYAA